MAQTSLALAASSYCHAMGEAGHKLLMVFWSATPLQKQDKSDLQEMGHDAVTVTALWGPGVSTSFVLI